MSFVSQTTILFSRKKVYGVSECVFLVRGFATDWRYLVAGGQFGAAWTVLSIGYVNNSSLTKIVDDELGEMLMDPSWLNQYQVFRNWVWTWENVWLADSWSMRLSTNYPLFGSQNRFILERSAKCFEGVVWLLDMDFVLAPSSGCVDVCSLRVVSNDSRELGYHKEVSKSVEVVGGVIDVMIEVASYELTSGNDHIVWKLFGKGAIPVFIPSPGPLAYFDLAISQNKKELRHEGLEVRNSQGEAKDGSPLLKIDIVLPDEFTRFCFSGRDAFKDLSDMYNLDLPSWYYE